MSHYFLPLLEFLPSLFISIKTTNFFSRSLVWTTPSILQHSNQTTKTNPPIPQIKCSYRKQKIPKRHIALLDICYYMKKKNTKGFISPLYLLLQVEGQRGCTTKEVAKWQWWEGTCITLLKILVGFVPTRKRRRKGL